MAIAVFDDADAASRAAARALVSSCRRAVGERVRFTLALAGGTSPGRLYELLATECRDEIVWSSVHVFWSDERYVAKDDPASNVLAARTQLIDRVPIPEENIHAPDVTLGDADACARQYEQTIRAFFEPEKPRIDWVLLGLGEDGHIASLFPGSTALEEDRRLVVAVLESPKPPPVRVTMTLPLIHQAREVHVLVSGAHKKDALERSLGPGASLPAHRLRGDAVTWWVDRAAKPE